MGVGEGQGEEKEGVVGVMGVGTGVGTGVGGVVGEDGSSMLVWFREGEEKWKK